jgi:hypothetical protein
MTSRDSSVDTATGYVLDSRGSVPAPQRPEWLWGPPGLLLQGVKRQGRGGAHSPPPSAEVKNDGSIHPHPHYVFMAWCVVN